MDGMLFGLGHLHGTPGVWTLGGVRGGGIRMNMGSAPRITYATCIEVCIR